MTDKAVADRIYMYAKNLQKLNAPVKLSIEKDGKQFHVTGKYYMPIDAFTLCYQFTPVFFLPPLLDDDV